MFAGRGFYSVLFSVQKDSHHGGQCSSELRDISEWLLKPFLAIIPDQREKATKQKKSYFGLQMLSHGMCFPVMTEQANQISF